MAQGKGTLQLYGHAQSYIGHFSGTIHTFTCNLVYEFVGDSLFFVLIFPRNSSLLENFHTFGTTFLNPNVSL